MVRLEFINNLSRKSYKTEYLQEFSKKYHVDVDIINNLSLEVHKNDGLLNKSVEHYFYCGFNAVQEIISCNELYRFNKVPLNILDFPCGFGRVGRWIRAVFPESNIYGVDLLPKAINFCESQFNYNILQAHKNFSDYIITNTFDIIWCGSLFTHITESQAETLLKLLLKVLNRNGLLIFTCHGRHVYERLVNRTHFYNLSSEKISNLVDKFNSDDYAFAKYNQINNYGISLNSLDWILKKAPKSSNTRLVKFSEKGWAKHQDVYVFQKIV